MPMMLQGGTIKVVRLAIPLNEFPELLQQHHADYLKKLKRLGKLNLTTDAVEALGSTFVQSDFPDSQVADFVTAVCGWGNYDGVRGKVLRRNTPAEISTAFRAAHSALLNGDPKTAAEKVTKVKGLAISFGSKHLKFLDPDRAVVLDSILSSRLGYVCDSVGYAEFVRDCAETRDILNAQGIIASPNRTAWRISDVEMAIFKKVYP